MILSKIAEKSFLFSGLNKILISNFCYDKRSRAKAVFLHLYFLIFVVSQNCKQKISLSTIVKTVLSGVQV